MSEQTANLIRKIDRLLDEQPVDGDTVDELVELLTPGPSDPWPDLAVVLHLAEHEAVADDLRQHALDDRLEAAIGEALEAVFPLLGIRPYGPTFKLVEIARRRLDAESDKFELVADRLEELAEGERVAMIERYLGTDPAPMFVNRLRRLYPEIVPAADAESDDSEARARLTDLAERLQAIRASEEPAREEVDQLLRSADDPGALAAFGLASEDPNLQATGAALMWHHRLDDQFSAVLHRALEGSERAPELAVLAARHSPERAKNVFSTFIAEVSWQNPELPEAELTEERVRAILTARSILPMIGSPMERLEASELPEYVEEAGLETIPARVEEAWGFWEN